MHPERSPVGAKSKGQDEREREGLLCCSCARGGPESFSLQTEKPKLWIPD